MLTLSFANSQLICCVVCLMSVSPNTFNMVTVYKIFNIYKLFDS